MQDRVSDISTGKGDVRLGLCQNALVVLAISASVRANALLCAGRLRSRASSLTSIGGLCSWAPQIKGPNGEASPLHSLHHHEEGVYRVVNNPSNPRDLGCHVRETRAWRLADASGPGWMASRGGCRTRRSTLRAGARTRRCLCGTSRASARPPRTPCRWTSTL
eukprot:3120836-Rhodomonas_salina.1